MPDSSSSNASALANQLAAWLRSGDTKTLLNSIDSEQLKNQIEQAIKKAPSRSIVTTSVAAAERGLTALDSKTGSHSRSAILFTLIAGAVFGGNSLAKVFLPTDAESKPPKQAEQAEESPDSQLGPEAKTDPATKLMPATRVQQYLPGLYTDIYVVPAPEAFQAKDFKFDGDLKKWDRSGLFRTDVDPAFPGQRYVEGMMMHDDTNLYIGATIGDPAPMRNKTQFPNDDQDPQAWKGGAVQIRLSLPEGASPPPTNNGEHFVHLDLWYCEASKCACLHIAHGMQFPRIKLKNHKSGDGFDGLFTENPDRRGCIVQYKIPWSTLFADPGKAKALIGDHRMSWSVLWGNASGDNWQLKLIELFNGDTPPNEPAVRPTYSDPSGWGTSHFLPPKK
jgi:hypothetical protein